MAGLLFASFLCAGPLLAAPVPAQDKNPGENPAKSPDKSPDESDRAGPIKEALAEVTEEVRVYNDHLTILASPWMEGRLPGTRGMELAKEYMEYYFRGYGLEAPYEGGSSYRQSFALGTTKFIEDAHIELNVDGETVDFKHGKGEEVAVTGMGSGGDLSGELVFVGYGIESGPNNFTSYLEGQDLTGKVAVMLRFEPLGERGGSKWSNRRGQWTARAAFAGKIDAAVERGAAAIVIVNTPGAADRRVRRISDPGTPVTANGPEIPILHMSTKAGERLITAATGGRVTLEDLTSQANDGPVSAPLNGSMMIDAHMDVQQKLAENIVAVLPGRGKLAEERIVIGAHLDHLGQGKFGSRDREFKGKKLHPGADDNATGCAGILLIADKMAKDYALQGDDAELRTIVFIAFSAEESGLNGSRYYAGHPLDDDIESHVLMMNFDMIGRMKDSRVKLSGTRTGDGLHDFVQPLVAESPLMVVQEGAAGGSSDHREFYRRGVPVLFSIIADLHADYHTSRDVSSLINRVEAVHAANLFYSIASAYAGHPNAFSYVGQRAIQADRKRREEAAEGAQNAPAVPTQQSVPARPKVQIGVRLSESGSGLEVALVTAGAPAAAAGIQVSDILISWNGDELANRGGLMAILDKSKAGDKIKVGVLRGDEKLELELVLRARDDLR